MAREPRKRLGLRLVTALPDGAYLIGVDPNWPNVQDRNFTISLADLKAHKALAGDPGDVGLARAGGP